MEKIWLKSYPRAYRTTSTPSSTALWPTCWKSRFRKHAKSPFSVCMDRWMNYGELERLSGALGAYLQRPGPAARCAGGHHAAQHSRSLA